MYKIGAQPFLWEDSEDGERIEDFMLVLCSAVPSVAIEILRIGFGDLRHWFNNQTTWRNAKCGCLVGQFAVVGRDSIEGCVALMDTHDSDVDDLHGAVDVLYMAIAAATKRKIHEHGDYTEDPLYRQIERVGYAVGNECKTAPRTQEVGKYLLDFIRMILTGMGYTKLPTSPAIPCKLAGEQQEWDRQYLQSIPESWYDKE